MKNRLTGVLALAVLLIMGLIVPAGANSENAAEVCPDGVDGWVKIDDSTGSATGDWGEFSYSGTVLTYEVEDGGVLQLCYKSGAQVNEGDAVYPGALTGPTSGAISIAQDYSHVSWHATYDPPPVLVDYCDPTQRPAGMSIADWLPADFDKQSCFEVVPTLECGFFDATVTGPLPGYEMVFLQGAGETTVLGWETLPAEPEEDAGDGSVDITVYLVGPESDYLVGSGLPNYWDDNGRTVTIDTDCDQPVEVDYCDPTQRPAGMSIADWLPEGFDTSTCFTVTPASACGSYDATVTGPYPGYEMVYLEGTDQTPTLDWETLPATFAEDYSGGTVDITTYLVGPESDYLVGSTLPNYWDGTGETITIDTDCLVTPPPEPTGPTPTPTPTPTPEPLPTPEPEPVEVLPEVIEAEPEPEPEVVEEDVAEPVVEEVEVGGVTATRAIPTGIDSGTGGYLPSSTPTAALLLMFGGLALASGAAASLVRRRG